MPKAMGKYAMRFGIGIAILMIAYFLLTKWMGLHQYPVLSALNGLFIGGGIFLALKKYKSSTTTFKYQDGFQLGLWVGGMATIIFSVFMTVFIFQIDTQFAEAVLKSWGLDYNKGSLILVMSLVIMGFSTSFVLTLAFMQLLKESWNQKH